MQSEAIEGKQLSRVINRLTLVRSIAWASLLVFVFSGCRTLAEQLPGAAPLDLLVGVVTPGSARELCFRTPNHALEPGSPVLLVRFSRPQQAIRTEVLALHPGSCPGDADADARELAYVLRWPELLGEAAEPMIGVIGSHEVPWPAAQDEIELDIDRDGVAEHFHHCTSQEGIHLSIWSQQALSGMLRWHRYVYLGYDVEPDCTAPATRDPETDRLLRWPDS